MKTGFGGVGGGTWRRGLLVTAAAWTMLAAAPLLPAEAAENDVLETVFTYSPPSGPGLMVGPRRPPISPRTAVKPSDSP